MKNIDSLCMNCFCDLTDGSVCAACGFDNDGKNELIYLPLRAVIAERYVIGKVIVHESDAVTYMAYDKDSDAVCRVREFLPKGMANHLEGNKDVRVRERYKKVFDVYKESFRRLWNTMHSLNNLSAVLPVYDVFDENGTIYAVCEYVENISLREFLINTQEGIIPWENAQKMFMPVLTTLEALHDNGIIHGSINPDNLLLCRDGKVRLKGFCISQSNTADSDLEFNVNDGYTAIEQYENKHKMCPTTDIYAFSACVYRSLVGSNPPDAPSRETNDKLMIPNRIAETIPTHVIKALGFGLQIYPEKRVQNVARFRELLNASPNIVAASVVLPETPKVEKITPAVQEPVRKYEPKKEETKKTKIWIIVLVVLIIAAIATGVYVVKFSGLVGNPEETTTAAPTATYTVPDFVSVGYTQSAIENNGVWNDQFKITFTAEYSKETEQGIIFKQSIKAGETVDGGTEIVLTVSKGIQTETVPDVGGLSLDSAKKALEEKGFKVSTVEVYNSGTHTEDTVKSMHGMAPAAGSVVAVGEEIVLQVYGAVQTTTEAPTTSADE